MDSVELYVNDAIYGGWKEAVITRSLESFAGGFRLQVTDNWSGTGKPYFIRAGDKCVLKLNQETVVTGWVEEITNSYDAGQHMTEVAGRDKTGDLVDCSIVYKSHEILKSDLLQIAKILCEPFGIEVTADGDVGPVFKNFSIQPGETVFEALSRAARQRGRLFFTDGEGRLVIAKLAVNKAVAVLKEGDNIKECGISIDTKERFSEYTVKSQVAATDENNGTNATEVQDQSADPGIKRYRPMVIVAEKEADGADAKTRAQWEAAHRAAESIKITIKVQGFGQRGDTPIWKVNELVSATSPLIGIDGEFLIGELEFRLSESSGSETTLTLKRADAYIPEPEVQKKGDPLTTYSESSDDSGADDEG